MNEWLHQVNIWSPAWAESLGRASWQGAIAILLVWGVTRCWRSLSPRVACWMWRLVCVKLLVGLVWVQPVELPLLRPEPVTLTQPEIADSEFRVSEWPVEMDWPVEAVEILPLEAPAEPIAVLVTAESAGPPGILESITPWTWLLGLWLIGICWRASVTARQWRSVRRLRRETAPADSCLTRMCREEAARLRVRRPPDVGLSSRTEGALLTGLWQPTILLPQDATAEFDEPDLRLMLAHELAHVRRRDLAWNWLPTALQWVLYFHPLIWLLNRCWLEAQEGACDELLIQEQVASPSRYGELLVRLASGQSLDRSPALVTVGVLGAYRNLERRIMTMTQVTPRSRRQFFMAVTCIGVLAVVATVPWSLVAADPAPPLQNVNTSKPSPVEASLATAPESPLQQDGSFAIYGTCYETDTTPLSGVRLRVFTAPSRTDPSRQIAESVSGFDGRYRFSGLTPPPEWGQNKQPPGYDVVATHPDLASAIRIVLEPEHGKVDIVLSTRATMHGRVSNEAGDGVSGATVYVSGLRGDSPADVLSGVTDGSGRYSIKDMFTLQCEKSEVYDPVTKQTVLKSNCRYAIRVLHPDFGKQTFEFSDVSEPNNFVLKAPAIIEGIVRDEVLGDPAAGVTISAQGTSHSQHHGWDQTVTESDGRYRLMLAPDSYNIWASAPDRTSVAIDSLSAVAGKNAPQDLRLVAGGIIAGRIVDAEGAPVPQELARTLRVGMHGPARPLSGAAVESVKVSDDGTFQLRAAPGRNYPYIMSGNVSADRDPSTMRNAPPVVVSEGVEQTLEIRIVSSQPRQLVERSPAGQLIVRPNPAFKDLTTSKQKKADQPGSDLLLLSETRADSPSKATSIHGRVITPDRKVATDAQVMVIELAPLALEKGPNGTFSAISAPAYVRIQNGRLTEPEKYKPALTSSDGNFSITVGEGESFLAILHPSGFAFLPTWPVTMTPIIPLEPWSYIQLTFAEHEENVSISLNSAPRGAPMKPRNSQFNSPPEPAGNCPIFLVDAIVKNGKFTVPPGYVRAYRVYTVNEESVQIPLGTQPLVVDPGETDLVSVEAMTQDDLRKVILEYRDRQKKPKAAQPPEKKPAVNFGDL